jgi:hypothetical protein
MLDRKHFASLLGQSMTCGSIVAACALSSCVGGAVPLAPSVSNVSKQLSSAQSSQTFHYTGAPQYFNVPTGVTSVAITARGAGSSGKRGGLVQATIPVAPGEELAIFVGGSPQGMTGGFNGGGGAGTGGVADGRGGGGAADVRQGGDELINRVIVAGGAAGRGSTGYSESGKRGAGSFGGGVRGGRGGSGGFSTGEDGDGYGGGGGIPGTQSAGGKGGAGGGVGNGSGWLGCHGLRGRLGLGGDGGPGGAAWGGGGGGGGGGYYGGGGGGGGGGSGERDGNGGGGGGGGGSAFAEADATNVTYVSAGGTTGSGQVTIAWQPSMNARSISLEALRAADPNLLAGPTPTQRAVHATCTGS